MPPDMLTILADYGLAGIIIVVLVWIINRFIEDMKQVRAEHADERAEWRESDRLRHEETNKTIINFSETNNRLADAIERQSNRHRAGD